MTDCSGCGTPDAASQVSLPGVGTVPVCARDTLPKLPCIRLATPAYQRRLALGTAPVGTPRHRRIVLHRAPG